MSSPARRAAHQQFIEFVTAFYRDVGCELPYYDSDADSPIAFEVRVDEVTFSVGYDPMGAAASLFVYCVFGTVPAHEEGPVLRRLLERNLALAREHEATYCIDSTTHEVVCYMRKRLAEVDVAALHREMAYVAQQAAQWRRDPYLHDPAPADSNGSRVEIGAADPGAPWVMFG